MNYHDPLRPTLPNGRRQYLNEKGKPLGAFGAFSIEPELTGGFSIGTFLFVGKNRATFFSASTSNLTEFFADYEADPEAWLKAKFGYEYFEEVLPTNHPINLDDLGL